MSVNQTNTHSRSNTNSVWQIIGRLITSAIVLAITAFFTPGFRINSLWALILAAVVLTIMDYLIIKFTGLHASSFGKGFVGGTIDDSIAIDVGIAFGCGAVK